MTNIEKLLVAVGVTGSALLVFAIGALNAPDSKVAPKATAQIASIPAPAPDPTFPVQNQAPTFARTAAFHSAPVPAPPAIKMSDLLPANATSVPDNHLQQLSM